MAWSGTPGSGNLLMSATDALAAGSASLQAIGVKSFAVFSGFVVQTGTNVGGSAAAITGLPHFYLQVSLFGSDCLIPIYRKV